MTLTKRSLEGRSFLRFDYPGPKDNIEQTLYLPFFQNIEVNESQKANYAVYDLLSRAGNLYAYMGAKSRSFTVKFSMTLPHIKHYIATEGLDNTFGFRRSTTDKASIRQQFLKQNKTVFNQANQHRFVFNSLKGEDLITNFIDTAIVTAQSLTDYTKKDDQAINLYLFWINMIRTSVINHSSNVSQGPPILTLTHGIMYNQVPCVCTNYSINIDVTAGYHLETMTPRKVDIVLSLEEVRTGNWGNYKKGSVNGNNLPGWESFVKYETMDPYGLT